MKPTILRGLAAAVLLAGLAAIVGQSIVPDVSTTTVVLYGLGGAAIAFAVVLAASVASLQFRQAVLRRGGTDPQWFGHEPEGLVRQREAMRAAKRESP